MQVFFQKIESSPLKITINKKINWDFLQKMEFPLKTRINREINWDVFSAYGIIPSCQQGWGVKLEVTQLLYPCQQHAPEHISSSLTVGTRIYFLGMKSFTQTGMCCGGARAHHSMQGESRALSSCGGAETP